MQLRLDAGRRTSNSRRKPGETVELRSIPTEIFELKALLRRESTFLWLRTQSNKPFIYIFDDENEAQKQGAFHIWADGIATYSAIKEFGPTIVFHAAFDGEQSVDPAFDQLHFGPLIIENGMHAPQKLGRRQSPRGSRADRLAAMRLRPSHGSRVFWPKCF